MREFAVPSGMRDLVLEDAKKKRKLQEVIEKRLDTWGYDEVMTPSIEFYRTYSVGFDDIQEEEMYKFFDDNGRILSLKADMTIPIARMVATKFKGSKDTLRFRYCANVFKVHETLSGNKNEITDCGVELIGLEAKDGDLEILVTALDALKVIPSVKVTLEIGNVQFFKQACITAGLSGEETDTLGYLIDQKSLIELNTYLSTLTIQNTYKEFFSKMVWWNGDNTILDEAKQYAFNDTLLNIIEDLKALHDALEQLGYKDMVTYDLGKIGNLNYYTGLIFDAFVEGIGFRVMSGGRYDHLIGKYGFDVPAVGFSIKLDQLMDAFVYEDKEVPIVIAYEEGAIIDALKQRKELQGNKKIILKKSKTLKGDTQ